jgi:hypothetical protein
MKKSNRWLRILGLVVLTATSCGGAEDRGGLLGSSGADAYPHETLTDWVTYGDAVVVFEVVAEKELPPSEEEVEAGEGIIMRELRAKVRSPIWSAEGATAVPAEFTFVSSGWSFKGDDRRPMSTEGAGRLEVGRQYVGPVSPGAPYGSDGWYPMHHAETLEWTNGRASSEAAADGGEVVRGEAVGAVIGRTAPEIAALLDRQTPDPKAAADRSLSPRERYQEAAGPPDGDS